MKPPLLLLERLRVKPSMPLPLQPPPQPLFLEHHVLL